MALSRTARFLLAALLVAAAAFVWVNFFNQNQLDGSPTSAGAADQDPINLANAGTPGASSDASTASDPATPGAAGSPAASGSDAPDAVAGAEQGEGDAVAGQSTADAAAQADPSESEGSPASDSVALTAPGAEANVAPDSPTPSAAASSPPVVVTEGAQVVTRDLVVDELPFLVLSPPPSEDSTAAEAAAAEASRPQASQRVTINPFSPIVVQAPPAPAATPQQEVAQPVQPTPPESTPIVEVRTDGQGASQASSTPPAAQTPAVAQAPAQPVRAPAPRAVAPGGTVAADLPRALPTGMLPTAPQILRDARSQPAVVEPVAPNIGDLAALREPAAEAEAVDMTPVDAQLAAVAVSEAPEPLGPGRPLSQPVVAETVPNNALPLAVGADPLSRYLRDNDVRFTGTVLGPLSVGVFRSDRYPAPVVITLGQALPDTDIILSDLRGYEARFTQGDRTQTLSLDLRR